MQNVVEDMYTCTYVMFAINKIPYTPSSSNTDNRLMTTCISRFSFLRKPVANPLSLTSTLLSFVFHDLTLLMR